MIVVFTGKLTLKVPWKNLYTEPTVAQLDGLFVIVVPNTSTFTQSFSLLTASFGIKKEGIIFRSTLCCLGAPMCLLEKWDIFLAHRNSFMWMSVTAGIIIRFYSCKYIRSTSAV